MSALRAKYKQPCAAGCGADILPGHEVVYVDDVLVHEECEELALVTQKHRLEPGRTDRLERLFAQPAAVECAKTDGAVVGAIYDGAGETAIDRGRLQAWLVVCTSCWLEKPCPCEDGLLARLRRGDFDEEAGR